MATDYKPVKGDKVKVTIEGEVTYVSDYWVTVGDHDVDRRVTDGTIIEKIGTTVEVFGPGDVVRGKFSGSLFALGTDRFVRLSTGVSSSYGGVYRSASDWTSEDFERVSIE